MLKGCPTQICAYEAISLKRIFRPKCFCLKIILPMLKMFWPQKIMFQEGFRELKSVCSQVHNCTTENVCKNFDFALVTWQRVFYKTWQIGCCSQVAIFAKLLPCDASTPIILVSVNSQWSPRKNSSLSKNWDCWEIAENMVKLHNLVNKSCYKPK